MRKLFTSAAAIGLLVAQAHAATVNVNAGDVGLNPGSGYKKISASAEAKPGDLVKTGRTGEATIVYDDGCAVTVHHKKVVRIEAVGPCAPAAAAAAAAPAAAAALTGGGAAGISPMVALAALGAVGAGLGGAAGAGAFGSSGNGDQSTANTLLLLSLRQQPASPAR